MVTQSDSHRDYATFDLARIVELALAGKVVYVNSSVLRDTENLGYSPDDVHQCLASLTAGDFACGEAYGSGPTKWHDVYKISRYPSPTGHRDDLYIKLQINKNCVTVLLYSFHRNR